MGYCTVNDVQTLLTKGFTVGESTVLDDLTQEQVGKAPMVTPDTIKKYIQFASQDLDASLTPVYFTPLRRIKRIELPLTVSALRGTDKISVNDAGSLYVGALVRLWDDANTELRMVKVTYEDDVTNFGTVQLDTAVTQDYLLVRNATVSLLEYPRPIAYITSRLATAILIDREFVGEQSPNVSKYGVSLRNQANGDIDKILQGVSRLDGQEHVGRRFARMSIRDTHSTTADYQAGQNRES